MRLLNPKTKQLRIYSFCLIVLFLSSILQPTASFALTEGPSQPEVQKFSPAGVSELVDPFTGDFKYNIPLMQVGDYPLNLSYSSNVSADQEASWVGFGWNLNPGSINRSMRGLPDEFSGDQVTTKMNMKKNQSWKVQPGVGGEMAGFSIVPPGGNGTFAIGVSHNTYDGVSINRSVSYGVDIGEGAKPPWNAGLGMNSGADGLTLSPSVSYQANMDAIGRKFDRINSTIGLSFNTRAGLRAMNFSSTYSTPGNIGKLTMEQNKSIGTSISFGTQTYSPKVNMPFVTKAASFSLKTGGGFFAGDIDVSFLGSYSQQKLAYNTKANPAYGYLHLENGSHNDHAMLDFNRENDRGFSENTPALPVTNLTYDLFNANCQGFSGQFRAFRGDVGHVYDSKSSSTSDSYSLGLELNVGNASDFAANINVTDVNSESGRWSSDNLADNDFKYKSQPQFLGYEPSYFKQVGEMSIDADQDIYNNFNGTMAVRHGLTNNGPVAKLTNSLIGNEVANPQPEDFQRSVRAKRGNVMSYLSVGESKRFALEKDLYSNIPTSLDHHPGEVTVLTTEGKRYVFGMPLYNQRQVEATFNIQGRPKNCNSGLATYQENDNSINNENGIDHYFKSTETPAYAHSWGLTAVLSPDYSDLTGDGPTFDDFGNYTVFSYQDPIPYKWRAPLGANKCNFNEGLRSIPTDDKGSYVYGEKTTRYLNEIQTRNYRAEFHTTVRDDGRGVTGENGSIESQSTTEANVMHKLDSISLYSIGTDAAETLIKRVHFEYASSSEELCQGVPNNPTGGGKLTLKKVYFTYGNSLKGKFNPYSFDYSTLYANPGAAVSSEVWNPDFAYKANDRWGSYQPAEPNCPENPGLSTEEFPYTSQKTTNSAWGETEADKYIQAWTLKRIDLPSGGSIVVKYESDDYAYVQNKRAMQMFPLVGFSSSELTTESTMLAQSNSLLWESAGLGTNVNQYAYFKLPNELDLSEVSDESSHFKSLFTEAGLTDEIFFRCLTNVTSDLALNGPRYEYITGYAELDNIVGGFVNNGNDAANYGYIKFKTVKQSDKFNTGVHPITKAAWQFGRIHLQKALYDQPNIDDNNTDIESVLMALVSSSFASTIPQLLAGPHGYLKLKGYGRETVPEKSYIRLCNPSYKKKGGGHRVSKVKMLDNWGDMVSSSSTQEGFSYGQSYSYTMNDQFGKTISSGVAAYEPQLGGDENPWRQPLWIGDKEQNLLAPDDKHYFNLPLGESFFPAPSVGYRKVVVHNVGGENDTKYSKTGKTVHEFYTAYDFPTKPMKTAVKPKRFKTSPVFDFFGGYSRDLMTATQGFSIVLNDMHGKPKAKQVFSASNDIEPISSVKYKYQLDESGNLDNRVTTIKPDGEVVDNELLGVEYDFVSDMREFETEVKQVGTQGNLATFLAGIFPGIIPSIFPSLSKEVTRFRSGVITKVIHTRGVLEETIATDLGSTVSTKNLAYDSETGQVLLTETVNSFDDPVFNLSLPAHWAYDGMKGAYFNIGLGIEISVNSGIYSTGNAQNLFSKGDVLAVLGSPSNEKFWVKSVNSSGVELTTLNDEAPDNGNYTVKVIRSGQRNQQGMSIGSLTTLENPIVGNSIQYDDILNASAIEYSDSWKTFCNCPDQIKPEYNDFISGVAGNYRPWKTHAYLTSREYTASADDSNIRDDGTYTSYSPFWEYDSQDQIYEPNHQGWQISNEISNYHPRGAEIENVDPLGNYSSALFGFGSALPTAVVNNSMYKESGFESFEDYDYQNCFDDHFSFRSANPIIVSSERHSGKHSLMIEPGESVEFNKVLVPCQ